MNNDLISREALKKKFDDYIKANPNISGIFELGKIIIDNAPTVPLPDFKAGYKQAILDGKTNFSRPTGEWINHRNDNGHNIADCSLCGKATQWHDEDEDGIPRFCWYCGADMQSDKKETTFDDYLNEQLKDPEFRKEYEKLCDEDKQKGDVE